LANITKAKIVTVLLITNNMEDIISHIFDVLTQYFDEAYRPIRQGDLLIVSDDMTHVYCKVVKVEPQEYGIVTEDTVMHYTTGPIQLGNEKGDTREAKFHVRGYKKQMA
jgi:transitional endoplasmic reticulum ATPase